MIRCRALLGLPMRERIDRRFAEARSGAGDGKDGDPGAIRTHDLSLRRGRYVKEKQLKLR